MRENLFSKMNCRQTLTFIFFKLYNSNIINSCRFWENLIRALELLHNSIDFYYLSPEPILDELKRGKPAIAQSTETRKTHSKFKLLLNLIESVSFH